MKIFVSIALISLLLPAIFQFVYGNKAVNKHTSLKFGMVCLISIVSQVVVTFLGMIAVSNSLHRPDREYVCGMPIVGLLVISFFLFLVMLTIMGVQLYIKVAHKNKLD